MYPTPDVKSAAEIVLIKNLVEPDDCRTISAYRVHNNQNTIDAVLVLISGSPQQSKVHDDICNIYNKAT